MAEIEEMKEGIEAKIQEIFRIEKEKDNHAKEHDHEHEQNMEMMERKFTFLQKQLNNLDSSVTSLQEKKKAMDSQVQKQLMLLEEALGSSNRKLEHQDNIDRVVKTLNFEKADRTDLIQMRKDNDEKFATIKELERHICDFKA